MHVLCPLQGILREPNFPFSRIVDKNKDNMIKVHSPCLYSNVCFWRQSRQKNKLCMRFTGGFKTRARAKKGMRAQVPMMGVSKAVQRVVHLERKAAAAKDVVIAEKDAQLAARDDVIAQLKSAARGACPAAMHT